MGETSRESETCARRLRLAREQAGLSQGQVAQKLKMRRPSVSEVESGKRTVSTDELRAFAKLYRVDIAWLAGGNTDNRYGERVQLAARELAKLREDDLESVLRLLHTLKRETQ